MIMIIIHLIILNKVVRRSCWVYLGLGALLSAVHATTFIVEEKFEVCKYIDVDIFISYIFIPYSQWWDSFQISVWTRWINSPEKLPNFLNNFVEQNLFLLQFLHKKLLSDWKLKMCAVSCHINLNNLPIRKIFIIILIFTNILAILIILIITTIIIIISIWNVLGEWSLGSAVLFLQRNPKVWQSSFSLFNLKFKV